MIRRHEAATYAVELAVTAGYAAILQRLNRRYEPDYTWVTVMIGVIISAGPPITLARTDPETTWADYERRTVAGFLTSGLIIIGWQLWQRRGRASGYAIACRISPEVTDADPATPLE